MKHFIVILFLFLASAVSTGDPAQMPAEKETVKIEKMARLRSELVRICACESTGVATAKPTHWNHDGTVKRGKINPRDIGICQINLDWNGDTAERMGLDLFKESDNIWFANWLYGQKGATPWNWSRACWEKK